MYRHCIYCSSELGANEALEGFPVGRSIAFDAARGRLWAVCPRCARWNLAPLEERWEVVEAAEKRFRDTRLRAQGENVGVARLADGTRLIRIGQALPGEVAAWRYGEGLVRRRRRFLAVTGAGTAALGAMVVAGAGTSIAALAISWGIGLAFARATDDSGGIVIHRFRPGSLPYGDDFALRSEHMAGTRMVAAEGGGFDLHVPLERTAVGRGEDGKPAWVRFSGYALVGEDARNALGRTMAVANLAGGTRGDVRAALGALDEVRDAATFLRRAAERKAPVAGEGRSRAARRAHRLAIEMALHDEQERRALDGELALLESAWREAEEIAAVADRLALEARTAAGPSSLDP